MTLVQCPCGEKFERPVQRGRPAVWCPECRELPVNKRAAREATDEDGEEQEEYRVSRYGPHDVLSYAQREAVEAGVAEVNRTFVFDPDADPLQESFRHQYEITKVYNAVDPKRWPLRGVGGGEEE